MNRLLHLKSSEANTVLNRSKTWLRDLRDIDSPESLCTKLDQVARVATTRHPEVVGISPFDLPHLINAINSVTPPEDNTQKSEADSLLEQLERESVAARLHPTSLASITPTSIDKPRKRRPISPSFGDESEEACASWYGHARDLPKLVDGQSSWASEQLGDDCDARHSRSSARRDSECWSSTGHDNGVCSALARLIVRCTDNQDKVTLRSLDMLWRKATTDEERSDAFHRIQLYVGLMVDENPWLSTKEITLPLNFSDCAVYKPKVSLQSFYRGMAIHNGNPKLLVFKGQNEEDLLSDCNRDAEMGICEADEEPVLGDGQGSEINHIELDSTPGMRELNSDGQIGWAISNDDTERDGKKANEAWGGGGYDASFETPTSQASSPPSSPIPPHTFPNPPSVLRHSWFDGFSPPDSNETTGPSILFPERPWLKEFH